MVADFPLSTRHVGEVSQARARLHAQALQQLTYQALLNCTKNSLNMLKKRVCCAAAPSLPLQTAPFFEVDVQLSVPSVRLSRR